MTLTGGRPLAFSLCERWIQAQTVAPDFWTVVDDVLEPTETTMGQRVIRRKPFWELGQRTLNLNLEAALADPRGDVIVIIEDDDHYGPGWLSAVKEHFTHNPDSLIYGEGWTTYYNTQTQRWLRNSNDRHASLCATAWRRDACGQILKLLPRLKRRSPFVDSPIWAVLGTRGRGTIVDSANVVGMKGLPGRKGCGMGHDFERSLSWNPDAGGKYLETLVGSEAAEVYKCFVTSPPAINAMPSNMRLNGQCSRD